MECLFKHKWDILFCCLIGISYIYLLSTGTSPRFEAEWGPEHVDSAIFQMMGVAILNGKTPYIDLFDHKGCILFFINALGYLIYGKKGLLILQMLNLSLTVYIWKRTISQITNSSLGQWLSIGLTLLLLSITIEDGNLSEEWCLPWISLPFYFYFHYKVKLCKDIPLPQIFIFGLSVGIIASIRANNIAPLCGLLLYLIYEYIGKSSWCYIRRSSICFLSGLIVPFAISFAWFYSKAGLSGIKELIFGSVVFNIEYMKYAEEGSIEFWTLIKLSSLLLLPCIAYWRRNTYMIPIIIAYIITTLSLGQVRYYHYLTIFAPLVVITVASLLQSYTKMCALGVAFLLLAPNIWEKNKSIYQHSLEDPTPYLTFKQELKDVILAIPKEERKELWNYNATRYYSDCMNELRITQSNRILLRKHMHFSMRLAPLMNKMKRKAPLWVLVSNNEFIRTSDQEFLEEYYEKNAIIRSEKTDIILYHRIIKPNKKY